MMQVYEFAPLGPHNSFGLHAKARFLAIARHSGDIAQALRWAQDRGLTVRVIGGGSNIVLAGDMDGLALLMRTRGIRIVEDDGDRVLVEAQAGEDWHELVLWAVQRGLGGLENLSLIPGTAGAAPVQNIGAYGAEFADICHSVTALRRDSLERVTLAKTQCAFGYRNSIFKQQPETWVVESICLTLRRTSPLRLDYGSLGELLAQNGVAQPCYRDVCEAVCHVRRAKLPDPADLGSAGSFFKNPLVGAEQAHALARLHPGLPVYPQPDGSCKLAAGWLIEKAGWKGKTLGHAGVYPKQALVLVNNGGADGQEILALAEAIRRDIQEKFGVLLEMEPVVYP